MGGASSAVFTSDFHKVEPLIIVLVCTMQRYATCILQDLSQCVTYLIDYMFQTIGQMVMVGPTTDNKYE